MTCSWNNLPQNREIGKSNKSKGFRSTKSQKQEKMELYFIHSADDKATADTFIDFSLF